MQQAYAPDVLVVDVDDTTITPLRPRTTTGDLTVQIHHGADGAFHRKAIGGQLTACGLLISRGAAHRLEEYTEPLCRHGCFTQFELEQAFKKEDNHE